MSDPTDFAKLLTDDEMPRPRYYVVNGYLYTSRGAAENCARMLSPTEGESLPVDALYTAEQMRARDRAVERAARAAAQSEIDALRRERDEAREDAAICRDAIEACLAHVEGWPDDTDSDAAVQRATRRHLNEAIGKAAPRLLMERREGQRLYGLNYRQMRSERDAAMALLRQAREQLLELDAFLIGTGDSRHDVLTVLNRIDALLGAGEG